MNALAVVLRVEPEAKDLILMRPIEEKGRLFLKLNVRIDWLDERRRVQSIVDENTMIGLSDARIDEEGA